VTGGHLPVARHEIRGFRYPLPRVCYSLRYCDTGHIFSKKCLSRGLCLTVLFGRFDI
jgi:hypothetical protein